MAASETRQSIVAAADDLFYENGFDHTSFAQVAEVVGISRGNFYYHFKTKDEILDAVIEKRLEDRRTMMSQWSSSQETPRQRVAQFIRILLTNEAKIKTYGCPIGTLFTELSKLDHPGEDSARRLFDLFRIWLKRQFELMGHTRDADDLGMHILARSQGVATLANAYPNEPFLKNEVQQMLAWLEALEASGNT
ncbi:TetR/AcrR family transcriptional regulator [uncultured Roseobacter sp.]|uniref:TetR/AcrR family transcriptional regulator n=1 Tax=uncultured Roseobacter sp. TaxID=114847 RepID=UPI002627C176|nr:TetR/AcrR family transcriptional regulator [uncultured Roseobacter sp.]